MTRTTKTLQMVTHPASRGLVTSLAVIIALVLLAGCVTLPSKRAVPVVIVCDIFHAPTDKTIGAEGFSSRIKRMTEQISTADGSQAKAMLHVRLATLEMDHRNPARDYARAGRHIDFYLALTGDIGCVDTARNVRGLLKRIESSDSSKSQVRQLNNELALCRQSYATCNENVQRLQEIELEMEKKRRNIR